MRKRIATWLRAIANKLDPPPPLTANYGWIDPSCVTTTLNADSIQVRFFPFQEP